MRMPARCLGWLLGSTLVAGVVVPACAQNGATGTVTGPEYGSGTSAGTISDQSENSPESDARPGVYYFNLAAQAYKRGEYKYAIDMYKVAASWAYKPAEYDLGLMYFRGQGIPVDHARGAAWMILAAERGAPLYVKARDLMVTALTDTEFKQADAIWNQLKPTYGDAVALQRAKSQWRRVASQATGSHLGHTTSNLRVGSLTGGPSLQPQAESNPRNPAGLGGGGSVTAGDVLAGGSIDGSVAYKQFHASDNPYDPAFQSNRSGTVTVEPLRQTKPGTAPQEHKTNEGAPPPGSSPPASSSQGA